MDNDKKPGSLNLKVFENDQYFLESDIYNVRPHEKLSKYPEIYFFQDLHRQFDKSWMRVICHPEGKVFLIFAM